MKIRKDMNYSSNVCSSLKSSDAWTKFDSSDLNWSRRGRIRLTFKRSWIDFCFEYDVKETTYTPGDCRWFWGYTVFHGCVCMQRSSVHVFVCMQRSSVHVFVCMQRSSVHVFVCMQHSSVHVFVCMQHSSVHVFVCMQHSSVHVFGRTDPSSVDSIWQNPTTKIMHRPSKTESMSWAKSYTVTSFYFPSVTQRT